MVSSVSLSDSALLLRLTSVHFLPPARAPSRLRLSRLFAAGTVVSSAMSSPPNPNNFRQSRFFKQWLSDRATYPLFIIMGCAATLVVFAGGRTLFSHPDVYVGKARGRVWDREDAEARGKRHSTNWIRSMAHSKSESDSISIWPSLNKSLLSKHVNPEDPVDDDDSDD